MSLELFSCFFLSIHENVHKQNSRQVFPFTQGQRAIYRCIDYSSNKDILQ